MAKPGATLRVPELKLGMNMSGQTLPRLTRLVGPARAKQIDIFAEAIGAESAAAWGLVDQVAADGEARAAALGLAEKAAISPSSWPRSPSQGHCSPTSYG